MKRYGNIYSKIWDLDNLREAHKNARKDKTHYDAVQKIDADLDTFLLKVQDILKNHTYRVCEKDYSVSTIWDKGKQRELWKLPYFPHRIIQWAILLQIEPIFMETFTYHTCASLKERGIKRALSLTSEYLNEHPEETKYCYKIDIHHFYQSINHDILKRLLRKKFKDQELLDLIFTIVDSCSKGIPIGSYLSQFLGNFYLTYFDHFLKEDLHIKYCIRYMDDVVIFGPNKRILHYYANRIERYLREELDLQLKPNYQIFPVDVRGVDFVGFRFYHGHKIILRKTTYRNIVKNCRRWTTTPFEDLTYKDFCSYNSYKGWIRQCNVSRFSKRYFDPLQSKKNAYYLVNIKSQGG